MRINTKIMQTTKKLRQPQFRIAGKANFDWLQLMKDIIIVLIWKI